MSSAWFGLLGVVVGGAISTVWAWLAVVRQEQTEAMVAARLVDQDLRRVERAAAEPASHNAGQPDAAMWEQQQSALARVLGARAWTTVAGIYHEPGRGGVDPANLQAARAGLESLAAGKRHVVPPRRWLRH